MDTVAVIDANKLLATPVRTQFAAGSSEFTFPLGNALFVITSVDVAVLGVAGTAYPVFLSVIDPSANHFYIVANQLVGAAPSGNDAQHVELDELVPKEWSIGALVDIFDTATAYVTVNGYYLLSDPTFP